LGQAVNIVDPILFKCRVNADQPAICAPGANFDAMSYAQLEYMLHALTRAVSRIICLAGGRLIAEGDPVKVLANPEVKEVYLGVVIDA